MANDKFTSYCLEKILLYVEQYKFQTDENFTDFCTAAQDSSVRRASDF